MTHTLLLAAVLAAAPTAETSQIPPLDFDITVETAELGQETLREVAPSTTVIGSDEIRASGSATVGDVLRRVAGVDIVRNGTLGRATTVRLDGASSAQTLVLLDGVELNSPTLGTADLSDLTVDEVERVEIVRGPMSALYGSQAMGGVINVITRNGAGRPTVRAELEAGSYGLWRGAVGSGGDVSDRISYNFGFARTTLDGREYGAAGAAVRNDAYENTTLSGGLRTRFNDTSSLDLTLRFVDANREIPIEVFGTQAFDQNSTQDDRQTVFAAHFKTLVGDRFEPFFRLGRTDAKQDFADPLNPGETGEFASDFAATIETDLTELALGTDIDLHARDRMSVGVEWERRRGLSEDSFSDGVNFDDTVDTLSFFAQNRLQVSSVLRADDSVTLTGGVRVDDVDGFGNSVNPRLSGLWSAPGGRFRIRAAAGRGFRAPSLNELLFPFFGNRDLEPEVARTYEVAVGGRPARMLDIEARLFRTDYDDLITVDPVTFTAVNLATAQVTGLEVEARMQPVDHVWLRGSYTHLDSEDQATGVPLLRRPRHKGAMTFAWERPQHTRFALELLFKGEQRDSLVSDFPENTPGWMRVDVAAGWTPRRGKAELFVRIENLLDKEYAEATGFPAPGIHGRAGVRVRF